MHTLDLSVHPVTSTLKMLASLLERITTANDKIKQSLPEPESPLVMTPSQHQIHTSFTRFHARSIPSISINAYLTRILKYCPCANECFLSLLVYFDRMARNVEEITGGEGRQFSIDSYNIHRLIIAGIMVSAKYFSDVFFTNSRYAKVGGLPVTELNQLEVEFLTLNNFALAISIEELQTYGDQLMKHWMCEESANREPEDDTPSTALPVTAHGSNGFTEEPQSGEPEPVEQDRQQTRQQRSHEPRRDASQESIHDHNGSGRSNSRQGSGSRHDQRQHYPTDHRHDHRNEHWQEPSQEYRHDHARSDPYQQQHHQHHPHHHQQQPHHYQGHSHRSRQGNGSESEHERGYSSDRKKQTNPQHTPITPAELTHATSRLAAPSPIH